MAELFGRARRLRPRSRRLDAPARRRRAASTAAGASSPASCRSRPASRSRSCAAASRRRSLCELGDGAVNMGAWHESLNLAALWNLPIVFLVVNNGYGMGTSVDARVGRAGALPRAARLPDARRARRRRRPRGRHRGVRPRCCAAPARTREPAVLEAMTYRYRGHSVADAGLAYRTKEEIVEHQAHDPIAAPAHAAARARRRRRRARRDRRARPTSAVAAAVAFADASPEPDVDRARRSMLRRRAAAASSRACAPGSPFGEEELVFDAGLGA